MNDIKTSLLINEKQIQKRVQELAQELNQKFNDQQLVAIGTLKGSFSFYSDLIRSLTCRVLCDFCIVSRYGNREEPSNEAKLILDTDLNISGRHVLLVEDIVDQGITLNFLQSHFKSREPLSLTTVTLIAKSKEHWKKSCQLDYVGFEVEKSAFLVGYGLDYQEKFRHLPYIAEIKNLN